MIKTILTITGASGAGKSTLERALIERYGGGRVRTITTRPRRSDESEEDYDFQTRESLVGRRDLLWKVKAHGHIYSVTEDAFKAAAAQTGGLAFVCITPEQHMFVDRYFGPKGVRCIRVHLGHPGRFELTRRLRERGENEESIEQRLKDSTEFEVQIRDVPGVHRIPPVQAHTVFRIVTELIATS